MDTRIVISRAGKGANSGGLCVIYSFSVIASRIEFLQFALRLFWGGGRGKV